MRTAETGPLTDGYVLCQECGHVEEYSDARANRQERCSRCGSGFFCGCHCCDGLARQSKHNSEAQHMTIAAGGEMSFKSKSELKKQFKSDQEDIVRVNPNH